jgi:putative FmdB family regulatory protein
MPLFDYRCDDCQGLKTVLVYSWSEGNSPGCEKCGGTRLTRLFSKFAVRKSWGESLNWTPSGETLNDVDEGDPANLDRFMGRVEQERGGQVTQDFESMRRELSADS